MYAVGFAFWNKVIRVFIRAVRQLTDSLARGEKMGSLVWRQPDFINPLTLLYGENAGLDTPLGSSIFDF